MAARSQRHQVPALPWGAASWPDVSNCNAQGGTSAASLLPGQRAGRGGIKHPSRQHGRPAGQQASSPASKQARGHAKGRSCLRRSQACTVQAAPSWQIQESPPRDASCSADHTEVAQAGEAAKVQICIGQGRAWWGRALVGRGGAWQGRQGSAGAAATSPFRPPWFSPTQTSAHFDVDIYLRPASRLPCPAEEGPD